jgi:phosphopantothenoylcysteine decarboxylase
VKILLGVTASVAATLTPKLVTSLLRLPEAEVKVVATPKSFHFFRIEDVPVPVLTDSIEWPQGGYQKGAEIPHIDLGEWADILLIAPLSADTLSDMAHGKTSKFLTSIVLAWPLHKKIVLAPAMNTRMWENPITQENLAKVESTYSAHVIGPKEGMLACKTMGMGAMANISEIVSFLEKKIP